MKTSIQKGKEGEEFVNKLAFKSFIKYWCYPNPKDEDGDKKEICDLLVLFKEICLIVSVKNYKYSTNERYMKKTIGKSIKQLAGAERKLFNYPRDIYIRHPERNKEKFRKEKYKKIYRLILNVGEPSDVQILDAKTKAGDYISVLDRGVFESAMKYLDTISDFLNYLEKREEILLSMKKALLFGKEKDLLALFLENQSSFPNELIESDYELTVLDLEDKWVDFEEEFQDRLRNKKESEEASRIFDSYIESNFIQMANGPELAMEFLSMNRLQRRLLSNTLVEFIRLHKLKNIAIHRTFKLNEFGISFLYHGKDFSGDSDVEMALQAVMIKSAQLRNYTEEHLLGLSIGETGNLYKVKYINRNQITSDFEKYTNQIVNDLGWFKKKSKYIKSIEEYPKK